MSFDLIPITEELVEPLTRTYAGVFGGPEWFEIEKCSNPECGQAYPGPVSSRPTPDATYSAGMPCWGCGQPLRLMSYYNDPDERLAEQIIRNAMAQDAFAGFAAKAESGDLVGFTWGYRLPQVDTPSVMFSSATKSLGELGFDPATTFYAAEIGVVPDRQRGGVAKQLAAARFHAARDRGFERVCFRTVDRRRLVGLYEAMFGSGRVRELFPDPNPTKSSVWFAVELEDLATT